VFDGLRLFPERASTYADRVDALYFFLVAMAVFFVGLIGALLLFFSVRYRRRAGRRAAVGRTVTALEITWTAIPLAIVLFVFAWSARVFFAMTEAPAEGMEVLVTAKQWMWKLQHPTGQREINALHVPLGRNVLLTMASEDVIHSFYVPAFRMKRDVVPGRYSRAWFQADRAGTYHLFCAEYCGTKHSEMVGSIVVLEPDDYERWLAGVPAGASPVEEGARLFASLRCATCHAAGSGQRGPVLAGRFGGQAVLEDGRVVPFDEDYVRESILKPRSQLSAGFEPLMPTYEGQVNEAQILQLGAYLRSLAEPARGPDGGEAR
jgi:cytochrome c oxidase subunit 2